MIKQCTYALFFGLLLAPAFAGESADGQEIYRDHCAVCHGLDAKGEGPMAPAMMIKPRNLTELSKDNEGVFPLVRVIKRIDGREELVSHGSPMPVYGQFFEGESELLKTEAGQPIYTSKPVVALVEWLKSVQE